MRIEANAIMVDYSSARPDLDYLYSVGVRVISRYLSVVNSATFPKILWRAERDRAFGAGLAIQPNFEWHHDRASQGEAAGRADGRVCADQLAALDWPARFFVCVSADTDSTPATYSAIADYFAGFRDETKREQSAYIDTDGGAYLLDRGLINHPGIWLPAADAWNTAPMRAVYARQWSTARHAGLEALVNARAIDDNTVISPFDAWAGELEPAQPDPTPTPKEVPEMFRVLHPDGRQFICTGPYLESATGPAAWWWQYAVGSPATCRDDTDRVTLEQWIAESEGNRQAQDAALDARIRAIVADELAKRPSSGAGASVAEVHAAVRSELDATRLTH